MEAAIARNSGGSYNPPAPASNVNTDGISNFNDLGSLNVNTGTTGPSPNAIAAEAAEAKRKAAEAIAAPSMEFVMGQGMRPVGAIEAGPLALS